MTLIVSIMGATCAGKTTFIDYCLESAPHNFAAVQVGKILRAKYPRSYFKGQNNPKHTAAEAWDLCEAGVQECIGQGVPVVLVDGQPRDRDQVDMFLNAWGTTPREFILFDAPLEERRRRAEASRSAEDLNELTAQRLTNDMISYFTVLTRLAEYGVSPLVVDTTQGRPGIHFAMWLVNQSRKEEKYVRPIRLRRSWPNLARDV